MSERIVALAGGVGGAQLAHGLSALCGDRLMVIVNTGDDFEHLGLHISPDLDTVMYTLGGIANPETGSGNRRRKLEFPRSGSSSWRARLVQARGSRCRDARAAHTEPARRNKPYQSDGPIERAPRYPLAHSADDGCGGAHLC